MKYCATSFGGCQLHSLTTHEPPGLGHSYWWEVSWQKGEEPEHLGPNRDRTSPHWEMRRHITQNALLPEPCDGPGEGSWYWRALMSTFVLDGESWRATSSSGSDPMTQEPGTAAR